jgi:hypothetical protein
MLDGSIAGYRQHFAHNLIASLHNKQQALADNGQGLLCEAQALGAGGGRWC